MTTFQSLGLSIIAKGQTTRPAGLVLDLTRSITDYSHSVDLTWGYDSASLGLSLSIPDMEDWLDDGCFRQIVVYDNSNQIIWEGFVNQVTFTAGAHQITRGPVTDIANRVGVIYSPLDTSVSPPASGAETETIIAEDLGSQAIYGVFERWVSAQNVEDEDADQIRDAYLEENRYPKTSHSLNPNDSGGQSLKLDCLGFSHLLEMYTVDEDAVSSISLSDKIINIIALQPNSLFTNLSGIQDNPYVSVEFEEGKRVAMTAIKNICALGGVDDGRWFFGMYGNMKAVYAPISTGIDYLYRASGGIFESQTGGVIYPWAIQPGKWVFNSDIMVGKSPVVDFYNDPRYMLIERVGFTAPYGVQLQGGRLSRLSQKLAKISGTGSY